MLNGSNTAWIIGDGMWSWGNAYMFEPNGIEILDKRHRYKYGNGLTAWYIIDAETVRAVGPYKK